MRISKALAVLSIVSVAFAVGCAAKRPVLYPNVHLRTVGNVHAQGDIDGCIQLAETYGAKRRPAEGLAGKTATDATVGAASGAAVGAIYDNAGQGALAGAVGSCVSGLTRGILRPREPDPTYRRFVERCLREKGYEPVSWR